MFLLNVTMFSNNYNGVHYESISKAWCDLVFYSSTFTIFQLQNDSFLHLSQNVSIRRDRWRHNAVAIFWKMMKKKEIIKKWDKRMGFFRALFSDGYGM